MEPKRNKDSKIYPISVRINHDENLMLEKMAAAKNVEKSVIIRDALSHYNEYLEHDAEDANQKPIVLRLYRYNALTDSETEECSRVRTITFTGKELYRPPMWSTSAITDKLAAMLYEDFGILPHWAKVYDFYHMLILYHCTTNNRFLVHERIALYQNSASYGLDPKDFITKHPHHFIDRAFVVDRSKFVNDFSDVLTFFSRYASSSNLDGISHSMAEDIGDNYSLLDELFEPYHKK